MNWSDKQAIISAFDKAANSYDEHAFIQREVADNLFAMVKNEIKNESLVLDGGCGTGYFHELLRKNKIYCPLIQSDISFYMCKKTKEYSSPKEYGGTYNLLSDIEQLPIGDSVLDLFFSSLTLQWVNDMDAPLREAHRVLKQNGRLVFSTIGKGTLGELENSFAQMDNIDHINDFLTKESVIQNITRVGFNDFDIKTGVIVKYHDGIKDIFKSIKGVGASYKSKDRRKYPGKYYFARLEEVYRKKFGCSKGLPVSWNVIYVTANK